MKLQFWTHLNHKYSSGIAFENMPDNSPDKIIENFHVKTAAFVRQVFAFGLERNIYYSIYILQIYSAASVVSSAPALKIETIE